MHYFQINNVGLICRENKQLVTGGSSLSHLETETISTQYQVQHLNQKIVFP